MVKFANKPKGRPSKRRTLKVKYKIERRVKQHNKRMRREARKMKSNGLTHRRTKKDQFLPNMFPFKQQLLDEYKKTLPQTEQVQLNILDQNEYGLINLENKCAYLPKPKENLIKKYVTNLEHILNNVQIVLELLDVRNPEACIDQDFRAKCQQKKIKIISILTKADTVSKEHLKKSQEFAQQHCEVLTIFSCDNKRREQSTSELMTALKQTNGGHIVVAGKKFTGKHSFITTVSRAAKCYMYSPCELQLFKINNELQLIDSPYQIEDNTGNPMFAVPNPLLEEGLQGQEQKIIRKIFVGEGTEQPLFYRDDVLEYYEIQDYKTVTDFVSKVGRAGKFFGKGGTIDGARVRAKVLTDWFSGKLNFFLE